ncbi:dihydroorotate dehydrogenase [Selenomonas sputigena]|uniref:dihydroorotate dehydrogenase n=1 Tax=Selenomonas sputigena TaxID=69823 RepID=UPI002232140F|nr:dihydroorotate dehydrogenase [Selenomonas sputigena]UZD43884.1 dihydroorotate dehydrogenase [Selenomonas sputigena]
MNRERLAVEVAGIRMATPIMGASGTFGFGMEYEDFLDLADVGAVVSKGITPKPRAGNGGVRIAETPAGMLNSIGLENPGIEAFCRDILPEAAKLPTSFIVNISAGTAEEYGEMAQMLDVDGVAGIEVNISCPNVKEGGIVFGTDPKQAARVTQEVKKHTKKPVIVKLSPNVTDITQMARAVEEAGADAVSLINTLTGMAIDVEKRQPLLGNITGGLSGPAVKPIALRMVYQAAQAVSIPVIGMGGIQTGEDVAAFLLVGASAVEIGAENFANPRVVVEAAEGLEAYLERQGIEYARNLTGALEL